MNVKSLHVVTLLLDVGHKVTYVRLTIWASTRTSVDPARQTHVRVGDFGEGENQLLAYWTECTVVSASMTTERGLLIVVEGLDRSGKSTQCDLLCKHIENGGKKARYVKFPGRCYYYAT